MPKPSPGRLLALFVGWPFFVSGAFYVSPWLGWPALAVAIPLWLGAIIQIGRRGE